MAISDQPIASGGVRSRKVTFTGATGASLAARLDQPIGPARAYALFAHCFTCSKDIFAASRIAAGLAARGIAVLRFDFTGLGQSEGEFANTNFSSNVGDLIAAVEFLRDQYEAPEILIGHSLGGAAVLAAAHAAPEARAVATIGAPADAAHVAHSFAPKIAEIEETGEAEVLLADRPFRIKRQFLEDIEGHTLEEQIANLGKALLVFHAPDDAQVEIENADRIFQAARHPKTFVALDGADHLLSGKEDATFVAEQLSAWATRYLTPLSSNERPENGMVRVSETRAGRFQQFVEVGDHRFFADEPLKVGGDDTGPAPYDFLLAGLGACTAMTMRMYADRKGLSVSRLSVDLTHEKVHARDCNECAGGGDEKIDVLRREISIQGNLTQEERAKLMEIADKCPVHRTLEGDIEVLTREKA